MGGLRLTALGVLVGAVVAGSIITLTRPGIQAERARISAELAKAKEEAEKQERIRIYNKVNGLDQPLHRPRRPMSTVTRKCGTRPSGEYICDTEVTVNAGSFPRQTRSRLRCRTNPVSSRRECSFESETHALNTPEFSQASRLRGL
jgi:hypothetical protein